MNTCTHIHICERWAWHLVPLGCTSWCSPFFTFELICHPCRCRSRRLVLALGTFAWDNRAAVPPLVHATWCNVYWSWVTTAGPGASHHAAGTKVMLARLAMWYSAWILRLGQRDQWYSWCLHFCGQRESLLVGFRGAWCFPRRSRN